MQFRAYVVAAAFCYIGEGVASAQTALESYVGKRTETAGPIVEQMQRTFKRYGVTAAPRDVKLTLRDVAKPTVTDPALTYAGWIKHAESAFSEFMRTPEPSKMPPVARDLEKVLVEASANPVLFTIEEGSREVLSRMHQAVVLIRHKMGNLAGADAAASALLHSHPDVPPGWLPSEIKIHYDKVLEEEGLRARGELTIEVNRPNALIYVNEFSRSRDGRFNGRLFPDKYRVLVRVGDESLRYDVVVAPDKSTRLELDWDLERALTVSDEWVGVTLSSNDAAAEELAKMRALARKMNGASSLVVLGVTEAAGRSQVSAALYEQFSAQTGKLTRRGRVALAGDQHDDAKLDALALFVMKGTPSSDVEDITAVRRGAEASAQARPRAAVGRKRRVVPLVLIGAGALAVIGGGALYAVDEDADRFSSDGDEISNTAPGGVALGAAGLVAIGVGSWLWFRSSRSAPTLAIGQSSAMLGWAGKF